MNATGADIINSLVVDYISSRCLHVATELGLADALDGEATADELAAKLNLNTSALDRMLRLLVCNGVFAKGTHGGYKHSDASLLLRKDSSDTLRSWVLLNGRASSWEATGNLKHAIRTGQASVPSDTWKMLQNDAEQNDIFNAAMVEKSRSQTSAIVRSVDWGQFQTIGDIAGGRGHLLQAILRAHASPKGILFDLPIVLAEIIGTTDVSHRITHIAGSFFDDSIPSCDAMILMEVLHNWTDDKANQILSACRKGISNGGKLFIVEAVVADDGVKDWPKTLDLLMLELYGAKQRTEEEYSNILETSGWQFTRNISTGRGINIIEAKAT